MCHDSRTQRESLRPIPVCHDSWTKRESQRPILVCHNSGTKPRVTETDHGVSCEPDSARVSADLSLSTSRRSSFLYIFFYGEPKSGKRVGRGLILSDHCSSVPKVEGQGSPLLRVMCQLPSSDLSMTGSCLLPSLFFSCPFSSSALTSPLHNSSL